MAQQLQILVLEDSSEKGKGLETIAKQLGECVDVRCFTDIFPGNNPVNYNNYDAVLLSPNCVKYLSEQAARQD